jgi:thiol:disulfide interchange protein DsbD
MLAFSLGLGVPFWIVGTFAVRLPKTGKWVMYSKSFFGAVMIIVALYVLKNGFPQVLRFVPLSSAFPVAALVLAVVGLAIGAVHLGFDEGAARAIRKAIGLALLVGGSISAIAWFEIPKGHLPWLEKESDALAKAQQEKRPMIIDFTADWCGACKKIANLTFSDPAVQIEAERFVLLKVDATHDDDPAVEAIQKRYGVVGLPTVIVLDSLGKEQTRFTDFVPASPFYRAIQGVK